MSTSIELQPDPTIRCRDYKIGCIGAGFIMADVQLAAYETFGFKVTAIASRNFEKAKSVADRWGIETTHASPSELLDDENVEIVDIAYPPHLQIDLVREAVTKPHIKGLLLQKPLAMNYSEAKKIKELCANSGIVVSVNQNMRFDQSMRVLKQLLDNNILGAPVIGTIEMRAIPHWAQFLVDYKRLTLLNMSIHHLDIMRFLFGEVDTISVMAGVDPRTTFAHTDGICVSSLKFKSGVMGVCLDDVWASPTSDAIDPDVYIKWRVEGTEGVAEGTIGWPDYPEGSPSTLKYYSNSTGGEWVCPTWNTRWFPDAFGGVMEQLQYAVREGKPPELQLSDNLKTMALVEATYKSIEIQSQVPLSSIS